MAANTAPNVNGSDPSILRQIQRQTDTALVKPASNPTVVGGTTTPTVTSSGIRAVAPVVSGEDVIFPQSTTTTSSNSVTINSSVNNDTGDITTVYTTAGRITVNPINQVINQYTSVDSGVSQILAGTGVTITSTGASGTGVVTINATGGGGNGDYGNSNVAAYLPTYTGNVGAGNVNLSGNIIGSGTINIDNRASGNSADINLYSADDILLQARDRSAGSTSEGGDINISAGDSAEDGDSSGGDVTITAGDGGAANVDFGGSGGFITLQSGRGGAASTGVGGESAEGGGALNLRAGHGGDNNGNIARGAGGGSVYIDAGDSTGNGIVGGSIYLSTGLAGPNAEAGDLQIQVPSSDSGPGGTWRFDGMGVLEFPGGGTIRNSDSLDIGGGNAISLEAGGVVNIYSDTNGNAYQWQFGDDGNLTLPGNSSSINYANGTPYGGGGAGGYIIPYEVATFVANTAPGFGEIQFADNEGSNSAPATAQKLFINESPTNEQSMGTIFQQWTSNSYRGTLSLNNGSDSQATFNISNGGIYFEPETYRGFNAGLNQIWGDDCSINQLIITNSPTVQYYNTEFLVQDDVFHASGLANGNTHIMLNVYGSSEFEPINPQYLWNLFTSFVNNVLYDGATLRTDTNDIRTQFYLNAGNFRGEIPPQDYYQWFDFADDTEYFSSASTTGGSGTGATVRVRVNADNTYTVLGTANPGTGYIGGETIVVAGTDLGGASPANDLTVFIDSVDGDGVITQVSYDSGTGVYSWPSNSISDGSDDQYDTGNYINTNLETDISYANGIAQTSVAAFGNGDYCVMYNQSIFCMVATGVSSSVTDLFYSGNLGSDGDGWVRWTGLRSSQAVTPNNQARYAYFDCEYLDGELTPTVGTTYNMNLDSAGINLDGYYAYFNNNVDDYYFGSNNTFRLESQQQLYVQSYDTMYIQTMTPQRGPGLSGPNITIDPADGCDAVAETNTPAQRGGDLNLSGGAGGSSDGVDTLGADGGDVNITGGNGSGNAQAGNVTINGGFGAVAGSINLNTDFGSNSSGKVTINTYDGNTNQVWEFRPDGSTIYPTLSVTRGDRTGTLTGQTLLFGDSTQGVIISTPNGTNNINDSQRIVINPGAGYTGTTGEGGDIYLYAGRGGDAGGSGGDIKIRGGLGPVNGDGGYIEISGGEANDTGEGGYIEILGGQSSNDNGGDVLIRGGQGGTNGGALTIQGGQGIANSGGNVSISGGVSGNGIPEYGNVTITSGASTWAFDNAGNLTFPRNGDSSDPILSIAGGANPRILSEDASLAGPANLEITALYTKFTGSSGETITIYPDDGEISGDANIQIWANAAGNTQYSWTFGNDGTLTVPFEGAIRSNDDTIMLQSYDTPNSISRNMRLGTDGALYLEQTGLIPTNNRTWLTINPNVGNVEIFASVGIVGSTEGGNLSIAGGAADQSTFNTSAGGNVNITGGLGASDDGGGGGPGGSVNISAGLSADPVGNVGNVVVTVGGSIYTFTELDLNVTTNPPASPAPSLNGFGLVSAPIFTNGNGNVTINSNSNEWVFDSTGNLTIPGSSGGFIKTVANASIGVAAVDNGTNNPAQLLSMTNAGAATSIVSAYATNATIQTNATGTINTWSFDNAGALTAPGAITASGKIGYANGGTATQSGTGQGVTVNQLTGQITLFKSSWNAGDTEIFNISCNKVANADYVMAQSIGTTESSFFNVVAYPYTPVANSIRVHVTALETATVAPVVQYLIMKAATS